MNRVASAPMPFFARPIAKGIAARVRGSYLDPNVTRNLAFMETTLGRSGWFCGNEMTAADIQMSFAVEAAEVRTNLETHYPNLRGFLLKIRALPAYRAALEKGGPYTLMGQ
jgi:glutathione S-transferase